MTLAERIEKFNNLMGDIVPPEVKKDLLDKGVLHCSGKHQVSRQLRGWFIRPQLHGSSLPQKAHRGLPS